MQRKLNIERGKTKQSFPLHCKPWTPQRDGQALSPAGASILREPLPDPWLLSVLYKSTFSDHINETQNAIEAAKAD